MASGNDERAARLTQGSLVRGVKNSVFLFGGNAISAVISFVITIYIARILPLADFGSYITVISFVTLFGIFTDFGINTVVIREGAKNPEDTHSLIFSTMGLKYLLSLASMLAVIVFALFTPYTFEVKALIVLMSITLLMGGVGSMFSAVFNIYQDMKYISIIQIAERLTFASFAFVFLVVGLGVPGVILAVIIAAFVSLTLNFVISQRIHEYRLNFRPILDSKTRSEILMPAFWFGIAGLLGTVWQRVDTIMLSLLANMTQVGLYTPAVNYVGIGDMAVLALTGAFFPIISRTVHERIITRKELSKYLGYFAVAGLVIVAITYAFGGELMILAFGPKFTESIVFINILVIGFAVNLITIPTALMLDATNNQKVHVVNATYLTGTNIGLNWILIPTLGALGAAYATTISQSLGAILGIPLALYVLKRSGYL
ncbi:MAG TPA: flippase [Candidatus Bathyarchaeia archaeon]|nr:flippase [Candidatus Bathyarchaeia archaeon]